MNVKEAKKILPKDEFETFESVLMNQIGRMSSARLKQRATLSRKLRNKYRDLARHQLSDRDGRGVEAAAAEINERRANLFQEIIWRLEEELERPRHIQTAAAPVAKKKAPRVSRSERRAEKTATAAERAIADARRRPR